MATEIIMPKVDMVMETGTFVEWLKQEGQPVQKGEALFVILTDKATIECESPANGILGGINAVPDDVIPVTNVIGYILAPGEVLPPKASPLGPVQALPEQKQASPETAPGVLILNTDQTIAADTNGNLLRATPLARTIARELGLDINKVKGFGPRGRIYRADVISAAEAASKQEKPAVHPVVAASIDHSTSPAALPRTATENALNIPLPNARERERIQVKGVRAVVARRLAYSASTTPHIFLGINVDMSEVVRLRQKLGPSIEARMQTHLSFTAIIAFVVARLLPSHPFMNSSLVGSEIVLWEDIHLGIATALGDDLIVPVVRQAQSFSLDGMVKEMNRLLAAAREHKLEPAEMTGSTFTISNLGMYGIDDFTAIINPPEAAILGVAKMVDTPMVVDGNVVVRPMIHFCLGTDHRINDGLRAAHFLTDLKNMLENPYLLF